jgi:hypothetical protein
MSLEQSHATSLIRLIQSQSFLYGVREYYLITAPIRSISEESIHQKIFADRFHATQMTLKKC